MPRTKVKAHRRTPRAYLQIVENGDGTVNIQGRLSTRFLTRVMDTLQDVAARAAPTFEDLAMAPPDSSTN